MDCNNAGDYMMKYMDGALSEPEADRLKLHLDECESCKADFLMYDRIMAGFTDMEVINAPEGFEVAVMARIKELPVMHGRAIGFADGQPELDAAVGTRTVPIDAIIYGVWGAFSVAMGAGFILVLNREPIMSYLSQNHAFSSYMGILDDISGYVAGFTANITGFFDTIVVGVAEYIPAVRTALFIIFAILAVVQVLMRPMRGRAE